MRRQEARNAGYSLMIRRIRPTARPTLNEAGQDEDQKQWLARNLGDKRGHPADGPGHELSNHRNDRRNGQATRKATPPFLVR